MNKELRKQADEIIKYSIEQVLPDNAVKKALANMTFTGKIYLVAAGKAAWQMTKTAYECLGDRITDGVCVTKYGHVREPIPNCTCYEAGHPVPDENSFKGTQAAIDLVSSLTTNDTVLFLLSGGGSALFEKPLISSQELADITSQLLNSGANIIEMNIIRKRLSAVKGGRFAELVKPAHIEQIILSDVLGDPLDMIASGPAVADTSTSAEALAIAGKYKLQLSDEAFALLTKETPKQIDNVTTQITGSVRELCAAACIKTKELGFEPILLTDHLDSEAKYAGVFIADIAKTYFSSGKKLAFIAGGETIVRVTGNGLGGRNQELVLAAASEISDLKNCAIFSVGSDGTDGPTDAAGGYVDGDTYEEMKTLDIDPIDFLSRNDSYHALEKTGGLIKTGPTGTNVNDLTCLLISL